MLHALGELARVEVADFLSEFGCPLRITGESINQVAGQL